MPKNSAGCEVSVPPENIASLPMTTPGIVDAPSRRPSLRSQLATGSSHGGPRPPRSRCARHGAVAVARASSRGLQRSDTAAARKARGPEFLREPDRVDPPADDLGIAHYWQCTAGRSGSTSLASPERPRKLSCIRCNNCLLTIALDWRYLFLGRRRRHAASQPAPAAMRQCRVSPRCCSASDPAVHSPG